MSAIKVAHYEDTGSEKSLLLLWPRKSLQSALFCASVTAWFGLESGSIRQLQQRSRLERKALTQIGRGIGIHLATGGAEVATAWQSPTTPWTTLTKPEISRSFSEFRFHAMPIRHRGSFQPSS